jgi:hypothetical protein
MPWCEGAPGGADACIEPRREPHPEAEKRGCAAGSRADRVSDTQARPAVVTVRHSRQPGSLGYTRPMATVIYEDGRAEQLALPSESALALRAIERAIGGPATRLVGHDLVFVRLRWSERKTNPAASARVGRAVGGPVVFLEFREQPHVPARPRSQRQQIQREIKKRKHG